MICIPATLKGLAMADPSVLNPHPPEFDRFLYASVGKDRNGYAVTVLSTLARLGLDPWNETAELVTLGGDAARARLGSLLARSRDVPALARNHGRVARDLSQLLPEGPTSGALQRAASTAGEGRSIPSGVILTVLAVLYVVFQIFMAVRSGSGE
ncbi:hypothetical protein EU803_16990 [Loktanella sp. IMCC34160]|uniref:hypothetical protein n=1 Tax=Loktanella sp. IMCC34160 TaxID=2510646 RepID=UPI00101D6C06|nr:hypothetical protein [Loktanella sp. IMCC34160]RYG89429.1 hypothetical protein EU803_16990 [Loktanella sp. IMCC34160]